jgi:hypothetical protein
MVDLGIIERALLCSDFPYDEYDFAPLKEKMPRYCVDPAGGITFAQFSVTPPNS